MVTNNNLFKIKTQR